MMNLRIEGKVGRCSSILIYIVLFIMILIYLFFKRNLLFCVLILSKILTFQQIVVLLK